MSSSGVLPEDKLGNKFVILRDSPRSRISMRSRWLTLGRLLLAPFVFGTVVRARSRTNVRSRRPRSSGLAISYFPTILQILWCLKKQELELFGNLFFIANFAFDRKYVLHDGSF